MNKGILTLGALISFGLTNLVAQQVVQIDPEKSWAFVIGISNYAHAEPLLFAATDAQSYAEFLKSPRGGSIPPDHIVTLLEEDATRTRVEMEIEQLWDKVQDGDTVFIFIAGHGLYNKRRIAYFIPSDGNPATPNSTSINLLAFQQMVTQGFAHARQRILITDMCHAGTLAEQQNLINQYMKDAFGQAPGGAFLNLLASGPSEPSWENDELGHGVFTYTLMEALNGRGLEIPDELIKAKDIVDFVITEVPKWTANQQNPVVNEGFDPSIALAFLDQPGPALPTPETATILVLANTDKSNFVRVQWIDPVTEAVTVQRIPRSQSSVPIGPLAPGPVELHLFDNENREQNVSLTLERGENQLDVQGTQVGSNRFHPGPLRQVAALAPAASPHPPLYFQGPVQTMLGTSSLLLKLNEGTEIYFDGDYYGNSRGTERPLHLHGLNPGNHTLRLIYSSEHEGRFRLRLLEGPHEFDPETYEVRFLREVDPPPAFMAPPFELADAREEQLYQRFADALWEGRVIQPEGDCADDYYQQLEVRLLPVQAQLLRKQLVVAMGDRAQRIILKYLRGGDMKWRSSTFEEGAKLVERIQGLFLENDFYRSQEHFFRGRAFLESGLFDEALQELEQSTALDPEASQSYNALGLTYWKQDQLDAALVPLERSIELTPAWNYPRITRAFIHLERRLFDQAESGFREAIQIDPEDGTAHHGLGQLHFVLQRWPEAEAEVRRAIDLNPGNGYAYETLGLIHQRQFRFREAEDAFRLAMRLEPDELSFRVSLAELFRQTGRIDQGRNVFQDLVSDRGEDPALLTAFADFLSRASLPEEAETLYKKALEESPDDTELRLKYGVFLRGLERYPDAIRELKKVEKDDPRNHFAPYQLAEVAFARERLSEAEDYLQLSIRINPRYAPPYRLLGQIRFAKRLLDEALEHFRKARELATEAHQRQELQELIEQVEKTIVEEQLESARSAAASGKTSETWNILADTLKRAPESLELRNEVLRFLTEQPKTFDLTRLPDSPLRSILTDAFWQRQAETEKLWEEGQKADSGDSFLTALQGLDGKELQLVGSTYFNFENEEFGIHALVYRWGSRLLEEQRYEDVLALMETSLGKRIFAVIPDLQPTTVDSLMRPSGEPEPQNLSGFEILHHPDRRAHQLFAAALAGTGDLQKGLSYLEALETRQPDLEARTALAEALRNRQAWEDAISILKTALARFPASSDPSAFVRASSLLSRIFCQSGDCESGRMVLTAALKELPDNAELKKALREIK